MAEFLVEWESSGYFYVEAEDQQDAEDKADDEVYWNMGDSGYTTTRVHEVNN